MANLAWKSLLHDKIRFAFTVLGVAFAVTLVLAQVGLFIGLLDNSAVTIENASADLWITAKNCPNVDFAHTFPQSHVHRVRSIPGVRRADNLLVDFKHISLPNGTQEEALCYALEDFSAWKLPWNVADGDPRDLRRGRFIVLDESATRRHGAFRTGEFREVNGQRVRIIGRSREALSFTTTPVAFLDFGLSQELSGTLLTGQTTYILVALEPGADAAAVRAEIRRRLPWNDVHTRAEFAAQSRQYWLENTGIGLSLYVTVFLGCLVGIMIVGQTLYTQTMEHLKEFGTVKAIGGTNLDIYAILGQQASIAAVIGFGLGVIPALALLPFVHRLGLNVVYPPSLVIATFVGTVALCLGASLVSFRKVASIDPALVFRA